MNILKQRYIEFGLSELYKLACIEQAKSDDRLYSPEMKKIEELREWFRGKK